ncbi:ATP-binding cassette domain-containing protein [Desulfopila inferna]|uniref:ATP-binding cassette domain-containing protein n=1 Tax=Desulfopila inferna TaxID=468528 RepID=UPI00196606E7|nr:ATP-binding cassette domain-containing protein [Desulfopila inferna]MBM9606340.1 ATP-binding cassette domain-containing protein [Desulfopila inferna]
MHIQNYHAEDLHIDHFEILKGEAWCVYGSNTSGISSFVNLLSYPTEVKEISFEEKPAVISFAMQQEIFEEEVHKDNSDFIDRIDPGTPARDFIDDPERFSELIHHFNLQDCLDKGYRQLSSGESRKLMLISTLSRNPGLLIFENPYDGVDSEGCRELDRCLNRLHNHGGHRLLITVTNECDIPQWCTHLAILQRGHIVFQGPLDLVPDFSQIRGKETGAAFHLNSTDQDAQDTEVELIRLTNGCARYGENIIFSDLHLTVKTGDHTLITGANGSGKSTLLQIITGDNQNCYANDLLIFGRKRGSGESIWDIKQQMGIVSPDLHRNHYIPGSALQVVLSGLFDSIGVYRQPAARQQEEAQKWLKMIGLAGKARTSFRRLSYAEQRLCLIARALIKMPKLLILDEPTQGLDHHNRNALLDFLETITLRKLSTILYAGHRSDEFRPFFRQHIDLSKRE